MRPSDRAERDVVIVGAGFGGLYALHKLRGMGLRALALDAAPSVGGTWWANRYPGARVDIQSLEYSYSFSEELQQDWHWTERYAVQPELLRYADHVADRFDLWRDIRLGTRIAAAHFDDTACRWRVTSDDGGSWTARFVVLAAGQAQAGRHHPTAQAPPGALLRGLRPGQQRTREAPRAGARHRPQRHGGLSRYPAPRPAACPPVAVG